MNRRPLPLPLATGIVLSFVLNVGSAVCLAWLTGKQSFDQQPGPDESYGLLYGVAAVMAVIILVVVRVLIWWLGLVVAGSLPATILFGLYNVFNGLVLVVPIAVETADPRSEVSTAAIAVMLGTAGSLVALGALFLLPSSLARARGE